MDFVKLRMNCLFFFFKCLFRRILSSSREVNPDLSTIPEPEPLPEPIPVDPPLKKVKKVGHIEGCTGYIHSVAFSPTGNTFAFTSDEGVKIFEFNKDGTPKYLSTIYTNRAVYVHYHPTLPLLAVCEDDGATFYRIDNGSTFKEIAKWNVGSDRPFSVSFHPTDPISMIGNENWVLYIVKIEDNACTLVQMFDATKPPIRKYGVGHLDTIDTIAFHPTGEFFATGSDDSTAKIFKKTSDGLWRCVETINHERYVRAVSIDSNGTLVTTSHDNKIRSFRINDDGEWECLQEFETEDKQGISSCAFHPEDPTICVTGSVDGNVTIYRRSDDGKILKALETLEHDGEVYCVAFDPSKPNRLLVGLRPNYRQPMNTLVIYELPQ